MQETEQYQFFAMSVSFLIKSPHVIFSILTSCTLVMLHFEQNIDVLEFVTLDFTNFQANNVCIVM